MNQGAVSLSMKAALLSPLTLPDSESDKNATLESAVGTHNSHHHCAPLNTDCLLSPVNPTAWKGASPHARFGLDIGGTLCKVVFFEPLNILDSTTPLSRGFEFSSVDVLSRSTTSEVEKNHGESFASTPSGSEECCCRLKLLGFPQDIEECRKEFSCKSSLIGSGIQQGYMSSANEDNLAAPSASSIDRAVVMSDDMLNNISDSDKERAKYCKTVCKLWISSHDPVTLQDRGTLYFKCFETWRMEEFLFLTKEHSLVTGRRALGATGGGARKFGSQFLEIAGLQLNRVDELKSLVRGIDFLMKHAQHESFEYPKGSFQGGLIQRPLRSPEDSSNDSDENLSEEENADCVYQLNKLTSTLETTGSSEKGSDQAKIRGAALCDGFHRSGGHEARTLYPYLVINIGSGVSILLVESPEQFRRVGGTSLGGSTFLGLASALTGCTSFKEAIDLAAEGDSTEIDMLVGDIYGGDYSEMGLAATTVASSFGKLVQPARRDAAMKTPQHLAKATLLMITNNIGSLAKLHAQATGVEHVLFTGSFMHGNKLAMRLLAVAMEFWSKGQIKAMFLRHEGHAGAMGALLNALDPCNRTDALLLS
ncbi:hypothetical protein GOP47_0029330 [Adiantum capillus-veneris]|nr:hypothetical protein GOP47_0029330 [Adiantum capillus-veneris]